MVALEVLEFAAVVVDALAEVGPEGIVVALAGVFAVGGFEFVAEEVVGFVSACEADDFELWWEVAAGCEVVEGGDEFAVGQVSCGAEDDDGAGFGAVAGEERFLKRIFEFWHGMWFVLLLPDVWGDK